jgi:hypothetical protein
MERGERWITLRGDRWATFSHALHGRAQQAGAPTGKADPDGSICQADETARANANAPLAIFIRRFAVSMYNGAWPEDGKVKPLTTRFKTRTRPEKTEIRETFHRHRSTL